ETTAAVSAVLGDASLRRCMAAAAAQTGQRYVHQPDGHAGERGAARVAQLAEAGRCASSSCPPPTSATGGGARATSSPPTPPPTAAPTVHLDEVLARLPPGWEPERIVLGDDSRPLGVLGLEAAPCPTVMLSIDAHHHAAWHAPLARAVGIAFVAQRDYLPAFV